MRAVIQRVTRARVRVSNDMVGEIGPGMVVLLGIRDGDGLDEVQYTVEKLCHLRIFDDAEGKMNCSVKEVSGAVLLISQFTLYGDARSGRRPSYSKSARPEAAEPLYEEVARGLRFSGIQVAQGRFGARMSVELENDGPVTLLLDSERVF